MASGFTWSFNPQFAKEFARYPEDQQDKILDFTELVEEHGIIPGQYDKFPGKLCVSWRGLQDTDPRYVYATSHHLWHYHIGLPTYEQVHSGFKTSAWVLHFQYKKGTNHVHLADVYDHHTNDNKFYLPSLTYLNQDVG
ncbi:hypothetical protein [uncultured Pantoea sp.]|uniref:hypothetical protein n=1 Tax=uncultured Pantoea sp. TaxID=218084 RepID=UPI0025D9B2C5|nr:hypothetical protein [uncultured Pantoea sp.]